MYLAVIIIIKVIRPETRVDIGVLLSVIARGVTYFEVCDAKVLLDVAGVDGIGWM